ncbi:hypothetical protein HDV04_000349 [Boothiomyces sp. JEL0838]|nr:hypothetical protein HDV04_000349 [Boothiomyces sp. JEL0838]
MISENTEIKTSLLIDLAVESLCSIPTPLQSSQVKQAIDLLVKELEKDIIPKECPHLHKYEDALVLQKVTPVHADRITEPYIPNRISSLHNLTYFSMDPTFEKSIESKPSIILRRKITGHKNSPSSKEMFDSHDKNNSHTISAAEFKGLVYSLGYFMSSEEASLAIASLDKDRDGEITYPEFLSWWESDNRFQRLQLSQEQQNAILRATDYFQYFDQGLKGHLNGKEFEAMFNDMCKWNAFFSEGATLDYAIQQIKGNNMQPYVSFNDYIGWLLRIGSIAPLSMQKDEM